MIKRQQNSSINAVSLLSIWLLLVVLIPAFSNVLIANYIPLPEALATTTIQREAYHKKWDSSKKVVMKPFYLQYPQYQKYTIPADKFSYAWYYAMMFSADEAAAESSKKLFQKLEKRQYIVRMLGYFLPSLYLQNQFNSIAKTDLGNHIHYLKSVKIFHRNISEFFYPYIFKMALPKEVDWKKIPKFEP
jgi:ABC-2 type transport system permease protein